MANNETKAMTITDYILSAGRMRAVRYQMHTQRNWPRSSSAPTRAATTAWHRQWPAIRRISIFLITPERLDWIWDVILYLTVS